MKVVYKILSVLLLCALFAGCASAAGFVVPSDAVVTPPGTLQIGDKVTATVTLALPTDKQTRNQEFVFQSDLKDPRWVIYVNDGLRDITQFDRRGNGDTLPGSRVYYDYPIYLRVVMNASVQKEVADKDINAMIITLKTSDAEISSYSSPSQFVYNIANFPSDVDARKKAAVQKRDEIAAYDGSGVNTAEAHVFVNQAEIDTNAAETYGTADITNALASLNAADKKLASAQEALNYAILNFVASEINAINNDVNTLNVLGAKDKAVLISTNHNYLVMMYNASVKTFETDKTEDLTPLYKSAIDLKQVAETYIAEAQAALETSTPTDQPTNPVIVQPTYTEIVQPTQTYVQPIQTYVQPTAPQPTQLTITLDGTTKVLLIIIVVLIAGLLVSILLLKNAKKGGRNEKSRGKDKGKNKGKDSDKWESL